MADIEFASTGMLVKYILFILMALAFVAAAYTVIKRFVPI